MRLLLALALVGLLSAGCTTRSHDETFDEAGLGEGWQSVHGTWRIVNASGEGRVLEARGAADPGLSSLLKKDLGTLKTFEIQVDVALLSGADPQGAGVVVDWKDDANYVIVRYSTHEHGWHLFTVIDGERAKRPDATLESTTDPGFNRWSVLRVVQEDGRIRAFDGDVPVIEYELEDPVPRSGLVGLFVRGTSRAYFDDMRVRGS